MPSDGQFHLTVPLTVIWIAQLAIIYGCIENKLPKKVGEIYLREIQLKCRQPVNRISGIKLNLKKQHRTAIPNAIFYKGKIDVEDGRFTGFGSYVLPLK